MASRSAVALRRASVSASSVKVTLTVAIPKQYYHTEQRPDPSCQVQARDFDRRQVNISSLEARGASPRARSRSGRSSAGSAPPPRSFTGCSIRRTRPSRSTRCSACYVCSTATWISSWCGRGRRSTNERRSVRAGHTRHVFGRQAPGRCVRTREELEAPARSAMICHGDSAATSRRRCGRTHLPGSQRRHLGIRWSRRHDVRMRTTLTLEPDVAARLKQEIRRSGKGLKALVNEVLRLGLGLSGKPGRAPSSRCDLTLSGSSLLSSSTG